MKKIIFSLAFISALLTSCVSNNAEIDYSGDNAVDVVIGINVPELAKSRADETNMNSGLGAIDNFSDDEWARYDIRYIFEVYDTTEGYVNLDTPIKSRVVQTYDEYQATSIDLRLIPNRTYKFVIWADFVEQGSNEDLNYDTTNLKNITRIANNEAMDESMDAYFIQEDIYVTENLSKSLTLTRPFGKIRVVTLDADEVNLGSTPKYVNIKFYNYPVFVSLNALSGQTESYVDTVTYSYNIAKEAPYTGGVDDNEAGQTLFSNYFFAQPKENGAQEVNFSMTVLDENSRIVCEHDFNTQIPLERNSLTTIMGNLFTTTADFGVSIDDDFDGEYNRVMTEATVLRCNYIYNEGDKAGNYNIVISDNGFDAENNMKVNSSYYGLSFYGEIAESDTYGYATIPAGVYHLDKANTGAVGTISAYISFLCKTHDDPNSFDDDEVKPYDDATLVVTKEGLTLTAVIEGVEHVVTYTGSLEINDLREEQPTEGVTFEANYIYGEYDYYGDEGGNYVIYLSDNGFVDGDEPLPNSTYYCLDIYGAKVEGESNGYVTIPAGEYHFVNEDNGLVGSITGPYSYLIKTGDYTSDKDIESEVDMFEDAVLVVTADGLELVAVIEGVEHHVTYTGSLEINDCR